MSEESVDARPLTSVEFLDAAVWREIGSRKRSRRRPFWTRYRGWLAVGSWCAPTHQKWML